MTTPQPQPYPAVITPRTVVHPPLFQVSRHCTHDGCTSTDTVTADGVFGRRCGEHPPTFSRAYLTHLLEHGWNDVALAYCRAEGVA